MDVFELFWIQSWLIGNQRNTVLRGGKIQDPTRLNTRAKDLLDELKESQAQLAIPATREEVQSWCPPPGAAFKLNFDAAVLGTWNHRALARLYGMVEGRLWQLWQLRVLWLQIVKR